MASAEPKPGPSTADSALMPPPQAVPPVKQEAKRTSPAKEERRPLSGMLPPKYKGEFTIYFLC